MSFYNLFFGLNKDSDLLLSLLGLTRSDVGRFRDCHIVEHNGQKVIAVYTRNGGGNREHISIDEPEVQQSEKCKCTGCIITSILPQHPYYLFDRDDEFDCTYATIYFKVPDCAKQFVASLEVNTTTPAEKWQILLDALQKADKTDPICVRTIKLIGPLIPDIVKKAESGECVCELNELNGDEK